MSVQGIRFEAGNHTDSGTDRVMQRATDDCAEAMLAFVNTARDTLDEAHETIARLRRDLAVAESRIVELEAAAGEVAP